MLKTENRKGETPHVTQKLLVLFPGIGYTCGTGLLAAGAARGQAAGYTVLPLAYSAQTARAARRPGRRRLPRRRADVGAQLAAVDWGAYTDIVFLSKSLGTVVAARSLRQLGVAARSLYLTPLAGALAAVRPGDTVLGMVSGGADSYIDWHLVRDILRGTKPALPACPRRRPPPDHPRRRRSQRGICAEDFGDAGAFLEFRVQSLGLDAVAPRADGRGAFFKRRLRRRKVPWEAGMPLPF